MKKQLLKRLCMAALGVIGMSSVVNAQHWLASVSSNGAIFSGQTTGNHLAVDGNGNTYTASSYAGAANATSPLPANANRWAGAFNPGNTTETGTDTFRVTTNATSGTNYYNGLVAKTNANGKFQWMLGFGNKAAGSNADSTTALSVIAVNDIHDAVYVGGIFRQSINFISGTPTGLTAIPTIIKPTPAATAGQDGLVVKLTTAGSYQWYKAFGGTGSQTVTGVATDSQGSLIVIGAYANTLTISGTTAAAPATVVTSPTTIISASSSDAFVAKFDKDGNLVFLKSIGGDTGSETIFGVATDRDNAIYIAGTTPVNNNTFNIAGTDLNLSSATGTNSYLAKLAYDVDLQDYVCNWVQAISSSQDQAAKGIVVDNEAEIKDRSIYMTGTVASGSTVIDFAGKAIIPSNDFTSPFAAKFRAETGTGIWAKVFNTGNSGDSYSVALNDNAVFVGGQYNTSMQVEAKNLLGEGTGTSPNGYIIKMDTAGSILDVKNIATTGTTRVLGLAVTNSAVYVNGLSAGSNGTFATTENFAGTGYPYYYRTASWDGFIIKYDPLLPLPVSLTDFKGSKTSVGNLLSWATLSETGNDYFELERSTDGINFSSIKTIKGANNSTEKISYSHVDANPLPGVNYYRLKQVDKNGAFSYSQNIVALNSQLETSGIKVYPNPGTGILNIQLPSESNGVDINVYNQAGKLVKSYAGVSGITHSINISEQASGIYFIQIIEKGKSDLVKYIKQ